MTTPEVSFASDYDGDQHMFAAADEAEGWTVEIETGEGRWATLHRTEDFVSYGGPLGEEEACWRVYDRQSPIRVTVPGQPPVLVRGSDTDSGLEGALQPVAERRADESASPVVLTRPDGWTGLSREEKAAWASGFLGAVVDDTR